MPILTNKPQNKDVLNTKPTNSISPVRNFTYLENRTILKGQSIGLLLALTYPNELDFSAPRR